MTWEQFTFGARAGNIVITDIAKNVIWILTSHRAKQTSRNCWRGDEHSDSCVYRRCGFSRARSKWLHFVGSIMAAAISDCQSSPTHTLGHSWHLFLFCHTSWQYSVEFASRTSSTWSIGYLSRCSMVSFAGSSCMDNMWSQLWSIRSHLCTIQVY